ncbi:phage tail protein [Massilia psychrophila]|uniref:Phage tail protein n=1 Tax=Massilia psychrophila TaxID=1603353 RepID=A0A2G8T4D3_9BURK|nr:phage tail protein [Massilia psychrophila]PIL40884.1 phage tail protein [Massilia psychrophila]GGE72523.1 phage tail protein [Massilia psychrophila]
MAEPGNVTQTAAGHPGDWFGDVYPVPAFYFKVAFAAAELSDDASFQEVSGLGSEMAFEEFREGGENRFIHRLPTGVKHVPLELKRGVGSVESALVRWCRAALDGDGLARIQTLPLAVYLMNAYKVPIRAWQFADAFPIKWEFDAFNSTKNEVAIEKIVLSYSYSTRLI